MTGGFYLSEDERATRLLRQWSGSRDQLSTLCHEDGIFSGPIFKKIPAAGPNHGVGYVSAKDIFHAHIEPNGYLSYGLGPVLEELILRENSILVTCSGMNLGKSVWVRTDMAGYAGSGDLIRILPDERRVLPGYIFSFLSSRFGHTSIRQLIYGGHIRHVSPEAIAQIYVPRLGRQRECEADQLIVTAAAARDAAEAARQSAIQQILAKLNWGNREFNRIHSVAKASGLQRRMDAFHHSEASVDARECLAGRFGVRRLGDLVEDVFEPGRGARIKVDGPSFGVPFHSSSSVFRLDPIGEYLVSRQRTRNLEQLLVHETDLLLPRSGQLGGIIGRAVLPLGTYVGEAVSEHIVRVRCRSKEDAHYLWAVFASVPGYYATVATAFGSSIPSLDCGLLSDLQIPWIEGPCRDSICMNVAQMVDSLAAAVNAERKSIALVERAIESAT